MSLFDVSVLVGLSGLDPLAFHSVIPEQGLVTLLKLGSFGQVIHGGRHPVRTVAKGNSTQFPQSILQTFTEACKALGMADGARFPVRVGQYEVIEHVWKALSADCDCEFGEVGEIRRADIAGMMFLDKIHFLCRPFGRPPVFDLALQST